MGEKERCFFFFLSSVWDEKIIKKKVENMYPKQAVSTDRANDLNIIFYRGVRANTKRMRVYSGKSLELGEGGTYKMRQKKK